jgi:hypothetical protein
MRQTLEKIPASAALEIHQLERPNQITHPCGWVAVNIARCAIKSDAKSCRHSKSTAVNKKRGGALRHSVHHGQDYRRC